MEYLRLSNVDFKGNIGNRIYTVFLARDVSVRTQKDKETKYLVFNMVDKGTSLEARLFGANERVIEMLKDGCVYSAAIDVKPYEKSSSGFSCIVYSMEPSDVSPTYFADWAENLEESQQIIQNAISEIIDTTYGKIAYTIIIKYWDKFSKWTGGKSNHHTKLGELLTHTAEVVRLSDVISQVANEMNGDDFINRPLVLSSAILHDIGKLFELDVDTASGHTEYSISASLSTHIMNGLREIDILAYEMCLGKQEYVVNEINEDEPTKSDEQIKCEQETIELLKHCIASHHGKLEYGSPIEPTVPEAYIISKADEMSAELYRFGRSYKELESGKSLTVWSQGGLKVVYKETGK